ncbi:MAG: hypothetical protein V9E83_07985 [Baekduia sp.]
MQAAARELVAARRRDYLMVTLIVLFPLMLVQFAASVIALRSADTSEVLALAPLQILVLIITVALLAIGFWLVVAVVTPMVRSQRSGGDLTADDALRDFRANVAPARAGLARDVPWRAMAPLIVGVLVVVALTTWLTKNEQTIGTAFVMMFALLLVATAFMPVPAVTVLLTRSGFVAPEPEADAPAEVADVPAPAPDPNAATSRPPPGSEPPAPAAEPASSTAPPPPGPPPARPSVPPPPS